MIIEEAPEMAPELAVSQWFNADTEVTLEALRGEVVVVEAFQMLCPGCVSHGVLDQRGKLERATFIDQPVSHGE